MFDMVLAVSVGVMLASLLFIRRMADLTTTTLLAEGKQAPIGDLPGHIIAYEIRGPLFFGAAEKAVDALRLGTKHYQALIIDMANVPAMDMTGIVALESVIRTAHRANVAVVLSRISPRLYRKLRRSGLRPALGLLAVASTLESAKQLAIRMRPGPASADPQPHNDRDQPSAPSR
jgi:SulP family sulfate permease